MAMAMEFIGLSPMGTASVPAVDPRKDDVGVRAGELVMDVLRRDVRPRDILTRAAFENAIAGVAATGGSTNAVLHLLAIAREAGVPLTIDDFDAVSDRTPLLADLQPGGRYVAVDLDKAGGMPLVAEAPGRGRLRRRRRGRRRPAARFAEEAALAVETPGQDVVRPLDGPAQADRRARHPQGQPRARGLRGQGRRPRAPDASRPGARLRARGGRDGGRHRASASSAGDVVVIRYEGPKGGPGMREMLGVTAAIVGEGSARRWRCSPTAASAAPRAA